MKRSNSGIQRGTDPPSTRPILDKAPTKALSYSNVYSPARNYLSSQSRTRSLSLDKVSRSSKRNTEKGQSARRSEVRTPKSASGRATRKLTRAISDSPRRKPATPFLPTSAKESRTSTSSTKSVSSGRTIQTAQDSLSLIEASPVSRTSALRIHHSKSCTGADMFRSPESPIEDSPLASNRFFKRAGSLGSATFQTLQDSLSLISLSPSRNGHDLEDGLDRRQQPKSKSFSGIAMYLKQQKTSKSPIRKPKLVSKHFSQHTCAFQDVQRSQSRSRTCRRECFRSMPTY